MICVLQNENGREPLVPSRFIGNAANAARVPGKFRFARGSISQGLVISGGGWLALAGRLLLIGAGALALLGAIFSLLGVA